MVQNYYQTEYPGAKKFGISCHGGAGTPSLTYFPFNGIFLSVAVAVEGPNTVIVGLHIPKTNRVQILRKSLVIINGRNVDGAPVELKPVDLRRGTADPPEFRMVTSPFGYEDYFGELVGETGFKDSIFGATTGYKTYRFKGTFDGTLSDSGTLNLPDLKIDGTVYRGPEIPFRKSTNFEMGPINC